MDRVLSHVSGGRAMDRVLSHVSGGRVGSIHVTYENDNDIVARQFAENLTGVFRLVLANDLSGALRHLKDRPEDLFKRDIVGATPVLLAYLTKRFELGQAIITECPDLQDNKQQLLTYEDRDVNISPYRGENVLHIAIVHRNVEAIQWLVDRIPDLLDAETTGSFFAPGMLCYLGGTPLLFAMASKLVDGAKVILAAAKKAPAGSPAAKTSIWMTDRFGNNALHLAVVHDLPDVYDFAIKYAMLTYPYACPPDFTVDASTYDLPSFLKRLQSGDKTSFNRFLRQYNDDYLTPLTLAAAMGKTAMFQHQMMQQTTTAWVYGPVTAKMIPLRDFEERYYIKTTTPSGPKNAAAVLPAGASELLADLDTTSGRTAVECLCSYRMLSKCIPKTATAQEATMRGRLELISTYEVKTLLDKKWKFVGLAMFRRALLRHIIFTLVFTGSTLFSSHYRDDSTTLADAWLLVLLECYVVAEIALHIYRELREMWHRGWRYTEDSGAAMVDNVIKGALVLLIVAAGICRAAGNFVTEDGFVASAILCSYLYMFFFLYGFRTTGPFVVMLRRMLLTDVVRFILVFASILMGFASALYVVSLLLAAFAATFSFDEYLLSRMPIPAQLFIFVYMVLVVIVLINLLIAMMGYSYDSIIDFAEQRWYAERANIMASMANGQSVAQRSADRLKYAVSLDVGGETERFIQVEFLDLQAWRGTAEKHDAKEDKQEERSNDSVTKIRAPFAAKKPSSPRHVQGPPALLEVDEDREQDKKEEDDAIESGTIAGLEATLARLSHGLIQHFSDEASLGYEDPVNREALVLGHVAKIKELLGAVHAFE
ncbi:hypothetical protein SPRG_04057 [Saprolegnia parasitica CBS 223.65]|uniref:Ion transport domain-containing protein n=1 Tax=Saprolegnia parasitica (strain CBS 223.65) TaxID=695850 RepID=A0A067CXB0_SAPPC|nr:hypothetical protein SPRG_04057 [Saprolegnia parasitica CBS 223.65]KDO31442.1 hypothetical protein SPRG_04057 [Saprolegnia parasitica CBS 223.65]|eukprot:XP_012198037.1 hypothetical protein SPRG_04057 [Saprolegnia parasitica CBS 223.65]